MKDGMQKGILCSHWLAIVWSIRTILSQQNAEKKCLRIQVQKRAKKRPNQRCKQSIASHWTVINKSMCTNGHEFELQILYGRCTRFSFNGMLFYICVCVVSVINLGIQHLCRIELLWPVSTFNTDNAMQLTALFHLVCNLHFFFVQHPIACAFIVARQQYWQSFSTIHCQIYSSSSSSVFLHSFTF